MTSQAIKDIEDERARQQLEEGWTPEHDDTHVEGAMAMAAATYAMWASGDAAHDHTCDIAARRQAPQYWPWDAKWWKPTDRRRDLVKAGALIVAEIERLDRKAAKKAEAQS